MFKGLSKQMDKLYNLMYDSCPGKVTLVKKSKVRVYANQDNYELIIGNGSWEMSLPRSREAYYTILRGEEK